MTEVNSSTREKLLKGGIDPSDAVSIGGTWPFTMVLNRINSGVIDRPLVDSFDFFMPTRPVTLYETTGGYSRRKFVYRPGMLAFSPPRADWSIEWEGVMEGVAFAFELTTIQKAVSAIYAESFDTMEWRLALSDHSPALAYLGLDIAGQVAAGYPNGPMRVDEQVRVFLSMAIRRYSSTASRQTALVGVMSAPALRAVKFIEQNLSGQLSVERVCSVAAVSLPQLNRIFRAEIGDSVWRYITKKRLSSAADELRRTQRSIADIAAGCGFSGVRHFRRSFKAEYGVTPEAYR